MNNPHVGSIVLFGLDGSPPRPAIILEFPGGPDNNANLQVFVCESDIGTAAGKCGVVDPNSARTGIWYANYAPQDTTGALLGGTWRPIS